MRVRAFASISGVAQAGSGKPGWWSSRCAHRAGSPAVDACSGQTWSPGRMHLLGADRSAHPRNSSWCAAAWTAGLLFVPSVVAGGMCYWQLQRKDYKVRCCTAARARAAACRHPRTIPRGRTHDPPAAPRSPRPPYPLQEAVVADAQVRLSEPSVDVLAAGRQGAPLPAYRRVSASGAYQHAQAMFVGPRPLTFEPSDAQGRAAIRQLLTQQPGAQKQGYLLITPLQGEGGCVGWLLVVAGAAGRPGRGGGGGLGCGVVRMGGWVQGRCARHRRVCGGSGGRGQQVRGRRKRAAGGVTTEVRGHARSG
jgi:hypothetical protein